MCLKSSPRSTAPVPLIVRAPRLLSVAWTVNRFPGSWTLTRRSNTIRSDLPATSARTGTGGAVAPGVLLVTARSRNAGALLPDASCSTCLPPAKWCVSVTVSPAFAATPSVSTSLVLASPWATAMGCWLTLRLPPLTSMTLRTSRFAISAPSDAQEMFSLNVTVSVAPLTSAIVGVGPSWLATPPSTLARIAPSSWPPAVGRPLFVRDAAAPVSALAIVAFGVPARTITWSDPNVCTQTPSGSQSLALGLELQVRAPGPASTV